MKNLLIIFLSFAVFTFSMQLPCRAMAGAEQSSCSADHCCDEEAGEAEDQAPGNSKGYENCCVYIVLSVEELPQFEYQQAFALQLKKGLVNNFHTSNFSLDFWQPPRL